MKIPGLSEALEDLRELPAKTQEMQESLTRIEALLTELVDIQRDAQKRGLVMRKPSLGPGYH